jgi:hypothetical protein
MRLDRELAEFIGERIVVCQLDATDGAFVLKTGNGLLVVEPYDVRVSRSDAHRACGCADCHPEAHGFAGRPA